jgi:hypothetical protein
LDLILLVLVYLNTQFTCHGEPVEFLHQIPG